MPSQANHVRAARANEELARHLLSTSWNNWATVAAFYSALHWVDAFLASRLNHHPADHRVREQLVATTADLRPIYGHYRALFRRCNQVRYELRTFTAADMAALIQHELDPVRDQLQRLLGFLAYKLI